jgi:hypothetical protein
VKVVGGPRICVGCRVVPAEPHTEVADHAGGSQDRDGWAGRAQVVGALAGGGLIVVLWRAGLRISEALG